MATLNLSQNAINESATKELSVNFVVDDINPLKASGPDDMQPFYHKSWNIIGEFVCNMVRSFFNHDRLPQVFEIDEILHSLSHLLRFGSSIVGMGISPEDTIITCHLPLLFLL